MRMQCYMRDTGILKGCAGAQLPEVRLCALGGNVLAGGSGACMV